MKKVQKVLIYLVGICLSLILIYNIYNMINLKILKKDLTTINGYGILDVISGSMEPTIKVGDLIVINTKDKNINVGDVVTFYDVDMAFVTHRVVSINDDIMITKGDANDSLDDPIPLNNIVGKYVFKINGLGSFLTSLKNPLVSIIILIIGILICYLLSYQKEIMIDNDEEFIKYLEDKKQKEKKEKNKKKKGKKKKKGSPKKRKKR